MKVTTAAHNAKAAIYTKANRDLTYTGIVSDEVSLAVGGPQWYAFPVSGEPRLDSGEYALLIAAEDAAGAAYSRYNVEAGINTYNESILYSNFPAGSYLSVAVSSDRKTSIYCTYHIGGAAHEVEIEETLSLSEDVVAELTVAIKKIRKGASAKKIGLPTPQNIGMGM